SIAAENVEREQSTLWLKAGYLQPETEGFVCAIQDQVFPTKYYQKTILKTDDGKCRLCKTADESLNHLLAGCSTLTSSDYLALDNQVAKIIYQQIAKRCGLLKSYPPYYKFNSAPVLENEKYTLY
ncbi:uncharacterized protein B4U79_10239, partial [Dinothrombium tinctorium]